MKFARYSKAILSRLAAAAADGAPLFPSSFQIDGSSLPSLQMAKPRGGDALASASWLKAVTASRNQTVWVLRWGSWYVKVGFKDSLSTLTLALFSRAVSITSSKVLLAVSSPCAQS